MYSIMSCCSEEVLDAINEYYKLKSKYEKSKENEIKKYVSDEELSKNQKRERFSRFKPKCVNCNRVGGTEFSNKKRILSALCKASPPCKLNIQIQLGLYDTQYNLLKEYRNYKNEDQGTIIKTKLNLFFNYTTEEETIKTFEEVKNRFLDINKIYNSLLTEYLLTVDNPERKMNMNEGIISLHENIEELKKINADYTKDTRSEYIRDMIELYINKIHPNAERNRNLKYSYNSIEEEDDMSILVQKPYTIQQIEMNFGVSSKIIKNER